MKMQQCDVGTNEVRRLDGAANVCGDGWLSLRVSVHTGTFVRRMTQTIGQRKGGKSARRANTCTYAHKCGKGKTFVSRGERPTCIGCEYRKTHAREGMCKDVSGCAR